MLAKHYPVDVAALVYRPAWYCLQFDIWTDVHLEFDLTSVCSKLELMFVSTQFVVSFQLDLIFALITTAIHPDHVQIPTRFYSLERLSAHALKRA